MWNGLGVFISVNRISLKVMSLLRLDNKIVTPSLLLSPSFALLLVPFDGTNCHVIRFPIQGLHGEELWEATIKRSKRTEALILTSYEELTAANNQIFKVGSELPQLNHEISRVPNAPFITL
jgi:hypothetical protein